MKLVIDENTLVGIGNAVRTKDGSTKPIPVVELADKILAIPSGGESHLLRTDVVTLKSNISVFDGAVSNVSCGSGDLCADGQIPTAPAGASYCVVRVSDWGKTGPTSRVCLTASYLGKSLWDKYKEEVTGKTLLEVNKFATPMGRLASANFCNGSFSTGSSVRYIDTNGTDIYNNFLPYEELLFGSYNPAELRKLGILANMFVINNDGHLVCLCARNVTNNFYLISGCTITIDWYDYEEFPVNSDWAVTNY